MTVEIGEYLVGAYLKVVTGCDVVDYHVRFGDGEAEVVDVLGVDITNKNAYLCGVSTHLTGLRHGGTNHSTIEFVNEKRRAYQVYAEASFADFSHRFMFWSPVVESGYLENRLTEIDGLKLVANSDYKKAVNELTEKANDDKRDIDNPAVRLLQILGSLPLH
jgi:hypothetical protein